MKTMRVRLAVSATRVAIFLFLIGLALLPESSRGQKSSDLDSHDFNVRRKAEIMQQVRRYIHQYDSHLFSKWMSGGDVAMFRDRVYDSDVQVYVDKAYTDSQGAQACYVDSNISPAYWNDLVFRTEPRFVNPRLVWHEVIHAISDDKELFTYPSPSSSTQDHHYIEWAEMILREGCPRLVALEQIMKSNDKKDPPDAALQAGQAEWRKFLLKYNRDNLKPIPDKTEQGELKQTCGFYCDPDDLRDGYVGEGYTERYFAKPVQLSYLRHAKFDVTIHPGESVTIETRIHDVTTRKPPKEGQLRFEYQTQGIWMEIGDPVECPCQRVNSRKWTPQVSDPTRERVFPIKVTYDYGHHKQPGTPFLSGRVTVTPWPRSLQLKFVEKHDPKKQVPHVTVRIKGVKNPLHKAPKGDVLIKDLKPSPGYRMEISAPGYKSRSISVTLPAAKTKATADKPKPLTIELESTTAPPKPAGKVKVPDLSGKSSSAAGAMLKQLGIAMAITQAPRMNPKHSAGAVISQRPLQGTMLAAGSTVRVVVNPTPRMSIGMKVQPDKNSYLPGVKLTFTEDVRNRHPKSKYTYEWYVDGKPAGKGKTARHTFTKPGRHYVQLVLKSSNPKENDATIKNIHVEYPPDIDVKIGFSPETNIYKAGSIVGFIPKLKNAKGITEYRWYVAGEYIGSGKRGVKHKFKESGEYEIKLGLRMGSNFDEVAKTRTLVVGAPGIGALGRVRNRFEARGAPEDLEILSSYYRGGSGDWSKPIRFNGSRIGAVDKYIMYDGVQDAGWNTGFLVYVPRDSGKIMFKIFHFRWPENPKIGPSPRGIVHYSGQLPLHNKTPIAESLNFTRQASRMCEVGWRTEDGSSCRARIGKFRKTDQDSVSGVKDLRCEEGVFPPIKNDDDADTDAEDDDSDDDDDTGGNGGSSGDVDDDTSDDLDDTDDLDDDDDSIDWDDTDDTDGPGGGDGGDVTDGDDVSDGTGATGSGKKLDKDSSGAGSGGSVSGGGGDVPNVAGLWVDLNGHQVTIAQSDSKITMKALENKGPVGWKTAPGKIDGLTADGDFNGWYLTAHISEDANRVTWSNRSVWKRIGSVSDADIAGKKDQPNSLVGLWKSQDGHYLHIYKNGEWWEVEALENKGPVGWKKGTTGRFDGKTFSILINSRVHFPKVSKDGTRMDWGQGNYWTLVNSTPTAQDIDSHSFHPFKMAGVWVSNDGHKIRMAQSGNKITATALENKGPVGWKTAGGSINFWSVSMLFGNRVSLGKVSEDGSRIVWGPNAYWARRKVSTPQGPSGPFIPYDKQGTNKLKILRYGTKKR